MWVEEASTVDISHITRFFTNQQYDKESGLYYFNARYYDPHLGSFLTPDPGMSGLNHYAYANSNPIKFTDPSGLMTVSEWNEWVQSQPYKQEEYREDAERHDRYREMGWSVPDEWISPGEARYVESMRASAKVGADGLIEGNGRGHFDRDTNTYDRFRDDSGLFLQKHPLFNDAMKTWGCLFLSGLAVSQKTTGKIFSAPEINFMQKFLTHGSQIEYQEVPNYGRMAIYLGNPSVQERDMCVKDLTNVINQGFIYSGNSNLSASLSGTGTPDFYIEMLYNKENAALDLPGGVHIPALYEDTHFRLLNSLREVIYDSDPCSKASSRISHSIYITDSNKEKK